MLTENKFSKYLLYAVGEIVLVVIGILIALQINNWNVEKIRLKEEQKIIEAIVKEIESSIEKLEESISVNKSCAERSKAFIENSYSKESFEAEVSIIPSLFCYTGNKIDNSTLNEILGTNSRALISKDKYLDQLRVLKLNYDRLEKTMHYVDSYWNSTAVDYFNSTRVGIYMIPHMTIETPTKKFTPNDNLFSVLGIMNGFQYSLVRSQEDLYQSLRDTLEFLKYGE